MTEKIIENTSDGLVNIISAAKNTKKRRKGKIRHYFPEHYVLIDIETTNLSPDWGEIIEIAALKIENDKVVETFNHLINPAFPKKYKLDVFITKLTGISNDQLNSEGESKKVVLQNFIKFVGNSIIVAHNATFDINFLYDAILAEFGTHFDNDYIDTLTLGRHYAFKDEGMKHHRVADYIKKFKLSNKDPYNTTHRALNDALFEKQIFDLEKERLGSDWRRKSKPHKGVDFNSFIVDSEANEDNPFYGLNIVFTGKLDKFTRNDACEFISKHGATPQAGVRRDTDILVVGVQQNNTKEPDKSSKQIKAEQLNAEGKSDIAIISDDEFLSLVNDLSN